MKAISSSIIVLAGAVLIVGTLGGARSLEGVVATYMGFALAVMGIIGWMWTWVWKLKGLIVESVTKWRQLLRESEPRRERGWGADEHEHLG